MAYFIPLLIPGKAGSNRRSLLVYTCSLPLSPQPTSAQAFCKAAAFNGLYSAWRAQPSLWSVLGSYRSKRSRNFSICQWCVSSCPAILQTPSCFASVSPLFTLNWALWSCYIFLWISLKTCLLYEARNCHLWVQLDKLYIPFIEEESYMCITHLGKPIYIVIIYFSYVTMTSCPSEVEGMWITCSVLPVCWVLCLHDVSFLPPGCGQRLPVQWWHL